MRGAKAFVFGLPDFDAAGQGVLKAALFAADGADVEGAVFLLVIANHTAFDELAVGGENPAGVEAHGKGMFEEGFGRFAGVLRGHIAESVEAGKHAVAKIVEQLLRLFGGDFERPWEPAAEGTVEEGIADKEHENGGKKRNGDGAHHHLSFESRT